MTTEKRSKKGLRIKALKGKVMRDTENLLYYLPDFSVACVRQSHRYHWTISFRGSALFFVYYQLSKKFMS